jgi:hypothetical protein
MLASCGSEANYDRDGYYDGQSEDERADARADARGELDGLTYQDQHGSFDCTEDCSGHDAGYQWAQDNGIEDAGDCGGNSNSFIEGCEAYANDLNDLTGDDGMGDYSSDAERDW